MKWNCYDLFDYYDPERSGAPKLQLQPMDSEAVAQLVRERTGAAPCQTRRRMTAARLVAGCTAAVLLITGGTVVTAAAASGGLEPFFRSLFLDEVPEETSCLEPLTVTPGTLFSSDCADISFSLLGMYGDQNQVILSIQITAPEDFQIPSGSWYPLVEYTVVSADGSREKLSYAGEHLSLRADETEQNVCYTNLHLVQPALEGKTLDITFRNFYDDQQIASIYDTLSDTQQQWQNAYIQEIYGADALDGLEDGALPAEFDVDRWKAYWDSQAYDARSEALITEGFDNTEPVWKGEWHAEIALDFPKTEPIQADYADGTVQLQNLSAEITYPAAWEDRDHMVVFSLTTRDGRWMTTDNTSGMESAPDLPCSVYAFDEDGDRTRLLLCYEEPIAPADVAELTMTQYVFREEEGWVEMKRECIYS